MKTFEIWKNGTYHATILAESIEEAENEYFSWVGNDNFSIYESEENNN